MKQFCLLVMMCGFCIVAKSQETVYIPNPEINGLKQDFKSATLNLLKAYIEETNRYKVITQPKADTNYYAHDNLPQISILAQQANAQYYALTSLNRLGETVIVSISLYKATTNEKVWWDKLKASSPDDLDPILERLAKNIGTPNKASVPVSIYGVTKYESKELRKIQHNSSFGLSLSQWVFFNNLSKDPATGVALNWSYDSRNIIADIVAEYAFNTNLDIYGLAFNVIRPFKSTNASPYLDAGAMFGGTTSSYKQVSPLAVPYSETSSAGGLLLHAGGGYLFNRNAAAQIRVQADLVHGFYKVNDKTTTGIVIKLLMLFK